MANQIDQLPYYDPLVKANGVYMADVWIAALSSLIDTLNGYMSQFGFLAPQLTTAQRDLIQSPVNGQIIYNTTLNKFQGFENSAWANLI